MGKQRYNAGLRTKVLAKLDEIDQASYFYGTTEGCKKRKVYARWDAVNTAGAFPALGQ